MRPLVTVGIPTYERPEGLRRTLRCIVGQTYDQLEIIVSDNGSTGNATTNVAEEFARADPRVRYVRQPFNAGSIQNCKFLLKASTGEYFMWAADDDWWTRDFIESCISELVSRGPSYVAVGMEAQYFVGDAEMEFFAEGQAFYTGSRDVPGSRIDHMLRHGYGNLFYSVFRREALVDGERSALDFSEPHGNELPMLVEVAARGNWRILPSVGMHKQTNARTYLQARWESCGGRLNAWSLNPSRIRQLVNYHSMVGRDIEQSLRRIGLDHAVERRLRWRTRRSLGSHLFTLVLGYKRRAGRCP